MNIAVIGAGSSGLITLKYLLDSFPASSIHCFEQSESVRGCWGNQREGFVSTSTKYTTQFSCFRKWQLDVSIDKDYKEFYRGAEFGDYLEAFAEHFGLRHHIQFCARLKSLERSRTAWRLTLIEDDKEMVRTFDAVFLCTGLVNQKKPLESQVVPVADKPEAVRDSVAVIVGGGESATDIANHLAAPEFNNKVFLSLRSGVRVSPRYHPIRGVPSDFLRNRLLLSFDKSLRNRVGEAFVSFRIRFNQLLSTLFPHKQMNQDASKEEQALRKTWDLKLKARAKGKLFNVFHNKSDSFLDAVAQKRLSIIGPPTDTSWTEYVDFDQKETFSLVPDVLVASTGFHSKLSEFSEGTVALKDFYHGCVHIDNNHLFLIGFARPVIGNIPSISEMQARYAVGILADTYKLPEDVKTKQVNVWQFLKDEYSSLDLSSVYPVEQYPYCDSLAKEMAIMPTRASLGLRTWLKLLLVPASTTHYMDEYFDEEMLKKQNVYTPFILIVIMLFMKLVESTRQYLNRKIRSIREVF